MSRRRDRPSRSGVSPEDQTPGIALQTGKRTRVGPAIHADVHHRPTPDPEPSYLEYAGKRRRGCPGGFPRARGFDFASWRWTEVVRFIMYGDALAARTLAYLMN